MTRNRWTAWLLVLLTMLAPFSFAQAGMPAEDRAGNPISLEKAAERIVCLSPSAVQVIVDLGLADRLVGVDTYSAGSKELPGTLMAFEMMAPDMERILALSPDLVLVTGMALTQGEDPFDRLREMGITVAIIPSSDSIAGILEDNLFIGRVVGDEAGAQALNDRLTERMEALRVVREEPVRVYFEISPEPLYSFGSGTFLNEMIELLGGRNIFAQETGWISVSEEAVVAAAPEVIMTNVQYGDPAKEILSREGWQTVPAVREGRVFFIDPDASAQSNHRIVLALEEMAEAMAK